MTASSARPEHLHQYAADTTLATRRLTAAVDEVARALNRHLSGGGEAGGAFLAVSTARSAVERTAFLAAATDRIAAAFEAADRYAGGFAGGRLAVTDDLLMARNLLWDAPGFVDGELLAPIRFADGITFAQNLRELPFDQQLEQLATVGDVDGYGPAFAAGVVEGLGADGLTDLVESIREAYESAEIGLTRADAAIGHLAAVFRDASRTLTPAEKPVELAVALAPGAVDQPRTLRLGLLRAMARTATGRNALRELVVEPATLPPQVVMTLVAALTGRHPAGPDDRSASGSLRLLADRRERRWGAVATDLPILHLLARSPLAAWAWEEGSPAGASRIAARLRRRGTDESVPLAGVIEGALIESVREGWALPYSALIAGLPDRPWAPAPVAHLPAIVAAAGQARPSAALSNALAAVLATHPEAFRRPAGLAAFGSDTSPTLTAYFAVLAADRDALAAATWSALRAFGTEAASALRDTPPRAVDVTNLLGDLGDANGVLIALERGARIAGHHHDAARAFAVELLAMAGGKGATAAASAGPLGKAGAAAARYALPQLEQAAVERWVDSDDGRNRAVTEATARAEPYLLAVAMADDPRWHAHVIDPDALRGLDVVRSAADRQAFRRWLQRQPDVVATPVTTLIQAIG